jgi:serine O-acetyltransferase
LNLTKDIENYKKFYNYKGKLSIIKLLLLPGFNLILFYRLYSALWQFGGPCKILSKLIWYITYYLFSCDISMRCKIAGSVVFPHPIGIVIGEGAELYGNNVIYQNVTLGQNRLRYPVLFDCTIYPNSVICGNLTLRSKVVSALTFLKGK